MKITKKPVTVEAIQWTGKNTAEVKAWMTSAIHRDGTGDPGGSNIALFVKRRSKDMTTTLFTNLITAPKDDVTAALWVAANGQYLGIVDGEWILKDSLGFYPCADSVIRATYEIGEPNHTGLLDNVATIIAECGRSEASEAREALGQPDYPPPPVAEVRMALLHALAPLVTPSPAFREAAALGWDAAIASLTYEDGTAVEIITVTNPYRDEQPTLHITDDRPHSRACGLFCQGHGAKCNRNCPTCGGKDES